MQQDIPAVWRQLAAMGAAPLHEAQGRIGAIDARIKALDPARTLIGRALTVDCRPDDNLALHCALHIAMPGDVIVVDAKGFLEGGTWGDLMSLSALQRGVAGLVIDGSIRDSQAIIDMGFPVFSCGISIKGTAKNQPGKVGEPIVLGGVTVHTGDLIVGDRDGLVVIAQDKIDEALQLSIARVASEDSIRARIAQGATTVELAGLVEKLAHFKMPLTRAELAQHIAWPST
jgi:4-hydroxy-4-methyl-2-oxoglutarate aldolase